MKLTYRRPKKLQLVTSERLERLRVLSRHPIMVPIAVLVGLSILSVIGYFVIFQKGGEPITPDSAFIVIISHDNQVQTVPSHKQSVGQLLGKLHITLNQGDVVEPAKDTKIGQDDFRINIYRAVPVQVVDGSSRKFAFSAATTPRSIAQQTGTNLYPEDGISAQPVTNFLRQGSIGEQIVIDRSVPVFVNLYGTALTLRTHANTVGDLLKEKGLTLAVSDQVLPKLDTPIKANQQIFVVRKGTKLKSVVEPIAMPIKTVNDPTLAYGVSAIRQQGSPGQRVITYQVDKKTHLRKIIQSVVVVSPVRQIVAIGTNLSGSRGDIIRAGIAAGNYSYVDFIVSHESRWNPTASNPSGAYGLCQALPGSKMASAGSDWATNPITQLKWCNGYAEGHYGSWASAYYFWVNHRYW